MSYMRFAKEEKELFKLLFMRNRSAEPQTEDTKKIYDMVQTSTGFDGDKAKLFHLEMKAYVHGIATITAAGYLELDTELVSKTMTDAYQGMKNRYDAQ